MRGKLINASKSSENFWSLQKYIGNSMTKGNAIVFASQCAQSTILNRSGSSKISLTNSLSRIFPTRVVKFISNKLIISLNVDYSNINVV